MDPAFGEEDGGDPGSGRGSRVIRHVIALVLVLIAVGGLSYGAWYGFQSWQTRGGEGLAPMIRADAGPTRVRPEQPGGIVIPHQNREILNDLGGDGAPATAERLLPPPEQPVARPVPTQAAALAPAPVPAATTVAATRPAAPAPQPVAVERNADEKQATAAIVPPVPAPRPQLAQAPAESAPQLNTAPAAQAAPSRPAEFTSVGALMAAHRVQLAAVDSEEAARRAWLRYQGLYPEALADLSLLVQRVVVNNRTYFRVQGGPLNAAGARRTCEKVKARGADCLVVRP
ncbi:MAG: SPOR domain-containing protein [Inquilinus sp.]|nr:SPOR domain-containing protein [Inquilinus sp.]